MDEVWTLKRSTTDGKIAGVCATVATRFGIDPFLVRVVCVLLALSAGIGLALYSAAWLLLPTDKEPLSPLNRLAPASQHFKRSTLITLVAVWTVLVAIMAGQVLTIGLGPVLIVAALWWVGVLKPRSTSQRPAALPVPPETERIFVAHAQAWRARVDDRAGAVNWGGVPVSVERVGPAVAPLQSPYQWQPAPWANHYHDGGESNGTPTAPVYASAEAALPTTNAALATRQRRRRLIGYTTMLSVLGAWTILFALGASTFLPYAGVALLCVGLGLVASTWTGRPKALLPGAVVLLVATLISLGPSPAASSLSFQPKDSDSLPSSISAPVGDVVIDLSELQVTATRTTAIRVAAGDVRVICPEHVNLIIEARMGAGTYTVFGSSHDGPGTFQVEQRPDPTQPTLTLTVEVAIGDLEVTAP